MDDSRLARLANAPQRFDGWFFAVGFVFALGVTLIIVWQTLAFIDTAQSAEATVVKVSAERVPGEGVGYRARFEFKDALGKTYILVDDGKYNPSLYDVGDTVQVLYQPDQPHNAQINSLLGVWIKTNIGLILTTVFAGCFI